MTPSLNRFREPDHEWPQPRKDADAVSDDDPTYEQRLENSINTLDKIMNEKEMEELNEWIAENVMGIKCAHHWKTHSKRKAKCSKCGLVRWNGEANICDSYSSSKASAMMVLEKCCAQAINVEIWFGNCKWWVSMPNRAFFGNAETLPLAIALFAKKLFSS